MELKRWRAVKTLALVAVLAPSLHFGSLPAAHGAISLKSVLSASGKSAYDAAAAGSYFEVSLSDYTAAFNNLESVTKVGSNDTEVASCDGAFSGQYVTVKDSSVALPANAYILGFASALNGTFNGAYLRLAAADTYKGTDNFLVSTYPTFNVPSSMTKYFLFKKPTTYNVTKYLGSWASSTQCMYAGSFPNGGYSGPSTTGPFTSFSSYTTRSINLQVMYTTVDQWFTPPPTVTLAIAGNVKSVQKGVPIQLSTSVSETGTVTFKYNGKNIGNCVSVKSVALSANCNWKPAVQGAGTVTAVLKPSDTASVVGQSSPLNLTISLRSNNR